jgi:mitochondrial cardiolipin hydrolase
MFSPDGGVRARIVSEISKATSTIDIAIYSFTADEIRDALVTAKNRGVAIRIIADSSQAGGQGSEIATLESLGFNLKRMNGLSGGILHSRYMIVDRRFLLTGNYNWSPNAEDDNFENAVFVVGAPVIHNFMADFTRL